MKRLCIWILAVQLIQSGPTYYFQVNSCKGFNQFVHDLLLWADQSKVPDSEKPVAGCYWQEKIDENSNRSDSSQ